MTATPVLSPFGRSQPCHPATALKTAFFCLHNPSTGKLVWQGCAAEKVKKIKPWQGGRV